MLRADPIITNEANKNTNNNDRKTTKMITTTGVILPNNGDSSTKRIDIDYYNESHNSALYNMPLLLSPKEERSGRNEPHRISFTTSDDETSLGELSPSPSLPSPQPPRLVEKTVRFILEPTVTAAAATLVSPDLTKDRREELWYQRDKLAAIKQEVKQVLAAQRVKERQQLEQQHGEHDGDNSSNCNHEIGGDNDGNTALVGLERFNPQRAVWKRSAIHYVLAAQSHARKKYGSLNMINANTSPNTNSPLPEAELEAEHYVRSVSLRCTGWARETAREQGYRDYCAAHDLDPSRSRQRGSSSGSGGDRNRKRKKRKRPATVATDPIEDDVNAAAEPVVNAKRARKQTTTNGV